MQYEYDLKLTTDFQPTLLFPISRPRVMLAVTDDAQSVNDSDSYTEGCDIFPPTFRNNTHNPLASL